MQRLLAASSIGYFVLLAVWAAAAMSQQVPYIMQGGRAFYVLENGDVGLSDFLHYYLAGLIGSSPDRLHALDYNVQLAWLNKVVNRPENQTINQIVLVPFVYPLMTPFAALSPGNAINLWNLLGLSAAVSALTFLMKRLHNAGPAQLATFFTWFAALQPTWYVLLLGQVDFFLLALLSIWSLAILKNRDVLAGITLALASVKPQFFAFFVVSAVSRFRSKTALGGLVVALALAAVTAATIGWENLLGYPRHLHAVSSNAYINAAQMITIRGLLTNFIPQSTAFSIGLAGLLLFAAFLLFVWRKARTHEQICWAVAVTTFGAFTFSPHMHGYDCVMWALPAVLTMPRGMSFTQLLNLPSGKMRAWMLCMLILPIVSWAGFLVFGRWSSVPFIFANLLMLGLATLLFLDSCRDAEGMRSVAQDNLAG